MGQGYMLHVIVLNHIRSLFVSRGKKRVCPQVLSTVIFSLFTHHHDQWTTTCTFLFSVSLISNKTKPPYSFPNIKANIGAFIFSLSTTVYNNKSSYKFLKRLHL